MIKRRFDLWKSRVAESILLIKNYMALNHYKLTLTVKAFHQLKASRYQRLALELVVNLFRRRIESAFTSISQATSNQTIVCREFQEYRSRVLQSSVWREWHSHTVKHKIAKMFFKRKYLRALQEYTHSYQYMKPIKHY